MQDIVVIWANNDKEKFAYKVFKSLLEKNLNVYPINPFETEILWKKVYKDLKSFLDTWKKIDTIVFIVNPKISLEILKNNLEKIKNKKLWFQPWTTDERVVSFLKENNFKDYVYDVCVMKN